MRSFKPPTLIAVAASIVLTALCVSSCVQIPAPWGSAADAEDGETIDVAEDPADIAQIIRCPKHENGVDCMIRCGEAGIPCRAGLRHPYKPEAGMGSLVQCRSAGFNAIRSCWYYYEATGDKCIVASFLKTPVCSYEGGRP